MVAVARRQRFGEFGDRLRLIALRLVIADQLECHAPRVIAPGNSLRKGGETSAGRADRPRSADLSARMGGADVRRMDRTSHLGGKCGTSEAAGPYRPLVPALSHKKARTLADPRLIYTPYPLIPGGFRPPGESPPGNSPSLCLILLGIGYCGAVQSNRPVLLSLAKIGGLNSAGNHDKRVVVRTTRGDLKHGVRGAGLLAETVTHLSPSTSCMS